MSDRERRLLEQAAAEGPTNLVKKSELLNGCLLSLASLVCAALLFCVILWNPHPVAFVILAVLLILSGIILFFFGGNMVQGYFRWGHYAKRFRAETSTQIAAALKNGLVESKSVIATRVIEVEEFEDEGSGYVFEIDSNRSLILKGQRYFPAEDSMEWPNDKFEIVRTQAHELWIGIFCHGKKLEPCRRIETQDCDPEFVWAEIEEIFSGTPEEYLRTIQAK